MVWRLFRLYRERFPIQRGKWRFARILSRVVGPAPVVVQGIRLELLPPSYIDEELIANGCYESEIENVLREALGTDDAFIDVGANLGWFSLLAARRGAKVIAFEPSPRVRERLRRNVELNDAANVEVRPVALGACGGELELKLSGLGNPGATTFRRSFEGEGRVVVPVRCLEEEIDAETLQSTRAVKIDVEGWEMEVLRGMAPCMRHLRSAVFVVEVTPGWLRESGSSASELYRFFEEKGFRPRKGMLDVSQYTEIFEPSSAR